MALTKSDIVARVHELGFTKKKSVEIIESLLEIMKSTLEQGDDILISGFGKFCVKSKNKRRGRNPATGSDLILRERKVVTLNAPANSAIESMEMDNCFSELLPGAGTVNRRSLPCRKLSVLRSSLSSIMP